MWLETKASLGDRTGPVCVDVGAVRGGWQSLSKHRHQQKPRSGGQSLLASVCPVRGLRAGSLRPDRGDHGRREDVQKRVPSLCTDAARRLFFPVDLPVGPKLSFCSLLRPAWPCHLCSQPSRDTSPSTPWACLKPESHCGVRLLLPPSLHVCVCVCERERECVFLALNPHYKGEERKLLGPRMERQLAAFQKRPCCLYRRRHLNGGRSIGQLGLRLRAAPTLRCAGGGGTQASPTLSSA